MGVRLHRRWRGLEEIEVASAGKERGRVLEEIEALPVGEERAQGEADACVSRVARGGG
jgi:hypothetical protein